MLKQGVKTINAEFIRIRALSQLSFVKLDLMQPRFTQPLFSCTLTSKNKKTQEMSLYLMPSFKTSTDARVEGLVSNMDYLENRCRSFVKKKYDRKRCLPHTHVLLSGL